MSPSGSPQDSQRGFNRRDFLKGSSAAAAATALASQEALAEDQGATVVSGSVKVSLNVNGKDHQVVIEPRMTLLDVLRNKLDLTGAKPVSGDGSSGASTVLVGGRPVMASTTLAITTTGKKIVTIEGLAADDAIPQAFLKHDAQQCGFCTPGFVVAVRAFLDKHPNASKEEIRSGLNGNICRCGTYANVIDATFDVAQGG